MIIAIIDIGSGSIGLALVVLEKDKVPTLKFSLRREMRFQNTLAPEMLLSQTLKILSSIIIDMQKKLPDAPSGVFCFLSPHLIASQTRTIKINFTEPTAIDESVINNVVGKEIEKFKTEALIEQKIMSVKLNGYEVSNLNKIAAEAEISVFFTLTSEKILDNIKDTISASFHNRQIEFHSFPFAYFSVLRDIFKIDSDFVCMDIGSEITDISLIKGGILERSTSFPFGKNEITRSLIDKTSVDRSLAGSMIKNYTEGIVEQGIRSELGKEISTAGSRWLDAAKSAIRQISAEGKLPGKFFILADKDVSSVFNNIIGSISLVDKVILNKEPEIIELTGADLNKFYNSNGSSTYDPFLTMEAIFVNKLLN